MNVVPQSLLKNARHVLLLTSSLCSHRRDVRTRDDDSEDAKTDVRARGVNNNNTARVRVRSVRVGSSRNCPPAVVQQEGACIAGTGEVINRKCDL